MPEAGLPPPRREARDVGVRFALATAALVVTMLLGAGGMVAWIFPDSLRNPPLPLPVAARPALQTSPPADMARLRADQLAVLNGTGWIDRDRGVIHIPIDLAIRKLVEEGIPDWPAADVPATRNGPVQGYAAQASLPPRSLPPRALP